MKNLFALFLLFSCTIVFAQNRDNVRYNTQGSLNIIAEPEVDALINKYVYVNQNNKEAQGYRIQIMQAMKSDPVLSAKAQVLKYYPHLKVYYTYDQPDFKLRVGDFTDRFEAHKAYVELSKRFDGAFIVRDMVKVE